MAKQGRVPARLPHSSAPLLLPLQVRKHGAKLLASMVNGMDDKDDPHNLVALEAMSSLSKLLDHLEERDIQSMLLHIAIRIRPFFDSVREPGDRACALVLSKAARPMSQGTRGTWVSGVGSRVQAVLRGCWGTGGGQVSAEICPAIFRCPQWSLCIPQTPPASPPVPPLHGAIRAQDPAPSCSGATRGEHPNPCSTVLSVGAPVALPSPSKTTARRYPAPVPAACPPGRQSWMWHGDPHP